MKILLIHPNKLDTACQYAVPQVALGYLVTALKKHGFREVKVIDFQLLRSTLEQVRKIFIEEQPTVVGIRFWSSHLSVVKDYVKLLREMFGDKIKIVVGGPHPSVVPREAIDCVAGIDFGFCGEAEEGLPLLIQRLAENNNFYRDIPGLIWRDENRQVIVNQQFLPKNLNDYLNDYAIDWESLNLTAYHQLKQRSPNFDQGRVKNGFLFCSRGCPYPCTYCSVGLINGKVVRYFSPQLVMKDIYQLYHDYGVRHFNIMDDNFTFSKDYVLEFCREYLKKPLPGVTFASPNGVRVDRLDEEILSLMKQCGWVKLMIGIESGDMRILQLMKKNIDLKKVAEGVRLINKSGIKPWGFFILGYPGETVDTLRETINYALKLPLTWASFSLFSPVPGTEIFKQLLAEGKIVAGYQMSDFHSSIKSYADDLTPAILYRKQMVAYLRFYSRPAKFLNLLFATSPYSLLNSLFPLVKIRTN